MFLDKQNSNIFKEKTLFVLLNLGKTLYSHVDSKVTEIVLLLIQSLFFILILNIFYLFLVLQVYSTE